jgi:hypothetical protein
MKTAASLELTWTDTSDLPNPNWKSQAAVQGRAARATAQGLQFSSIIPHIAKQVLFRWLITGSPISKLNKKNWFSGLPHGVVLSPDSCDPNLSVSYGPCIVSEAMARHWGKALKAEESFIFLYFLTHSQWTASSGLIYKFCSFHLYTRLVD